MMSALKSMYRRRSVWSLALLATLAAVAFVGWFQKDFLLEVTGWGASSKPRWLNEKRELALTPGTVFRECASVCPEMIVVPAGSFVMGSPEGSGTPAERPAHSVSISSFAVSRYHITFDEWDACVLAKQCRSSSDSGWGRGRRPVINVSWHDAKRYVEWLSNQTGGTYRLLSEAEWEYAARGQTSPTAMPTNYYWGDAIGLDNANCNGCGSLWDAKQTAPAGRFKPNAFGLHDMLGNAWDWVEDSWHPNYQGAPADGASWENAVSAFRVLRGGAWHDPPSSLRIVARRMATPDGYDNDIGIRIARSILLSKSQAAVQSTGVAASK